MTYEEKACAKLNLTLDVLGKRPDGYHELRMVMCSVELHDTVTVRLGTGSDECFCQAAPGRPGPARFPQGEENLALRAARAFADAAGVDFGGIGIRILKRVPAQAGMAGGSSDAAAVLRALNRHYGRFSDEQLREVGLRVGSDVPYCLFGGTALAEGRGERLTRLPSLPQPLFAVLVQPSFSVSTPRLFAALDERGQTASAGASAAMLEAIGQADAAQIGLRLSNDFRAVLQTEYPVVETIKQALCAHGALGSELTGTGSVVYGLFSTQDAASRAAAALAVQAPLALVTRVI